MSGMSGLIKKIKIIYYFLLFIVFYYFLSFIFYYFFNYRERNNKRLPLDNLPTPKEFTFTVINSPVSVE